MKKIQYSIARKETGNASGKAKKDAFDIASRMGFESSYYPSSIRGVRILQQIISLPRFMGNKIIFFQYPAVSEPLMDLFRLFSSKAAYKIALIHDLMSIQGNENYDKEKESYFLNIFNCIIVHNVKMKDYVKQLNYKGDIICIDLFDYLHDADHEISSLPFSNSIVFAGNLEKANFLNELNNIKKNWITYGRRVDAGFMNLSNVVYKGLLPSDEIQYMMEGDYGLVWDGDSIDECTGTNGKYLQYNNPHKLSCFIAAGKPVITWKQAAIASFVEKHSIGITVDSLIELNGIDLHVGYDEMKKNVLRIKREIAEGRFLEKAINQALELGGLNQ